MTRFYHYTKLRIIREYEGGIDVIKKYDISPEELQLWMNHIKSSGVDGLKVANVQVVRKMEATVEQL